MDFRESRRPSRPVRAPKRERSVLSPEEAARLLVSPEPWGDFRHYAINVLAATTGLRMGELRALRIEDVKSDHIEIRRSWEEGYGPRPPKADSMRDIPISTKVGAILMRQVIEETQPVSLLFYGRAGKDSPMSKGVIEDHLARALERVGISVEEQRERNISFHGWRHFLNSLMRSAGVEPRPRNGHPGHDTGTLTGKSSTFQRSWQCKALCL